MILILLASTVLSVLMGETTEALTIIAIVLLNAVLGFIQEFKNRAYPGAPGRAGRAHRPRHPGRAGAAA